MNAVQIKKDYSLTGLTGKQALEKGLAEGDWYKCPIAKDEMRQLLTRKDWPGIRDTFIWFSLLITCGIAGYMTWGTLWAVIPFAFYGVIYASTSDSRWHEASHGTVFKTDWLNDALYEVASFMVFRESTPWRWSHTRHHTDTIIVGRDPEIAVPRPANLFNMFCAFFGFRGAWAELKKMMKHSMGRLLDSEKEYIPKDEWSQVYFKARIYLLIYASVIGASIYFQSILPLMFIGLPVIYGSWLMPIYGLTQHTGLAEDVLDHRLNCRTVEMNFINRFFYWNMNYHIEHHMFPLVPYHALPKLHELMKDDCPQPYSSTLDAWKEIIPAVFKQRKDPNYFVTRKLPAPRTDVVEAAQVRVYSGNVNEQGVAEVCTADQLVKNDIIRYDHAGKTYAIYRTNEDDYYATEGMCTHGNVHLSDGLIIGKQIECPKHNGRFDMRDGAIKRKPVCIALKTYDVKVENGKILLDLKSAGGEGIKDQKTLSFKVVSNDNVATFIKELVLEPEGDFTYTPGDYIQLDIPQYENIEFKGFEIQAPYDQAWKELQNLKVSNEQEARRNYSMASNPTKDKQLRFNIRIATPPKDQSVQAGIGSSYVFSLKAGDKVSAIAPFGDFRIRKSDSEMIYIGGGAGMAPLRSHLSYLLETEKTDRKISFWYGARSKQELFYQEYFEELAAKYENFSFHIALSEPQTEDEWKSHTGFIHEVLKSEYLDKHEKPESAEYYLCGPPLMINAVKDLLAEKSVDACQISFDEF
ncbi:MAG: NADH:ubiquinone reductase (Na(+)-transporting) subunit F [Lentisphaeraceae bacterium]|nr:NADH:ubiquinone reductase (Na(+)-transporting) subunit F [Lentisphaeraceae bacterium]